MEKERVMHNIHSSIRNLRDKESCFLMGLEVFKNGDYFNVDDNDSLYKTFDNKNDVIEFLVKYYEVHYEGKFSKTAIIYNATSHDIVLENGHKLPKSGIVVRLKSSIDLKGYINSIKVFEEKLDELIVDTSNASENTISNLNIETHLVVSRVVVDAMKKKGYMNLYVPGNLIRDDKGNIIGCEGLIKM